ncbi:MAG: glycoside hydrolase family protein [Bacteroidales bacterium]|nr:glycoside hydrolase family protein [Bacteroidales bacterium]
MNKINGLIFTLLIISVLFSEVRSQTTVRERPAEWNNLVLGGRFIDLFLPMPNIGKLTSDTWGASNVIPRDIKNGIENRKYSFWGGNIVLGDDGKYHLFVCGWLESSPRGHATWPNSTVFHSVSDNSYGPFVVKDTIGKGHNPEVYRLTDGRYVLYVINGYYLADGIDGPWTFNKFEFLNRDRRIIDGLSNLTFAQREDGSYLMVNRGGGIWFSQTGLSPYNQVTEVRVYPPVQGAFEDPVVWRDNVQYNLIVNDWLGRIAFYLRSKDGITWVVDPGEAYLPGISRHEDRTVEEWFKYERMKVFQDEYGRAIQANFAVIDVEKRLDQSRDNHSSKNICIPLTVPRLLTILDKKQITATTKTIKVKIASEPGFNPHTDIDINFLRFGAPLEVNFGRGCKVAKTKRSGDDLIVTFNGEGNGITDDEFAAKMIGKTNDGKLLFGYARLPWVTYNEPILSARLPEITPSDNGLNMKVEVQNFGQVASKPSRLKIVYVKDEKEIEAGAGNIPELNPWQKTNVEFTCGRIFDKGVEYSLIVIINPEDLKPVLLHGKVTPVK